MCDGAALSFTRTVLILLDLDLRLVHRRQKRCGFRPNGEVDHMCENLGLSTLQEAQGLMRRVLKKSRDDEIIMIAL